MKSRKYNTMNNNNLSQLLNRLFAGALLAGMVGFGVPQAIGQSHVVVNGSVFGGGNAADVTGKTEVLVQDNAWVKTDIYGGGALANTGTSASDSTTVTIAGGTVGTADYGTDGKGNVFGGGLGDGSHSPLVNGVVTVNIGTAQQNSNNVVIKGNIFGCNNAAGTPKDSVRIFIYHTAHPTVATEVGSYATLTAFETFQNTAAAHAPSSFALQAVYGGGNKADYTPVANKGSRVHIYNCDNTVKMVYGGGRAAAVGTNSIHANTFITVDGGRIDTLFAGGDGHTTDGGGNYLPADINGNVSAWVRCGYYSAVFGASNTSGTISGTKTMTIDNSGPCADAGDEEFITAIFGGGNAADIEGDVELTVECGAGEFVEVYGGSNKADIINGNVTLNLYGGTFHNVYGGSKGVAVGDPLLPAGKPADIDGNVTLNLYGGTMVNAFGGSNINGNITGDITVNVLDWEVSSCELHIDSLYGSGNLTAYMPDDASTTSPVVNLIHINNNGNGVTGDVFGGGLGSSATVTANPQVNIGYDAGTMSSLIPAGYPNAASLTNYPTAKVSGNVFGGGEEAPVAGTTSVLLRHANSLVSHDIYGGGKLANVSGATTVTLNGGNVTQDVYGGGALANTGGATVTLAGAAVRDIYGGGLGRNASAEPPLSAIAAQVTGPVAVTVNSGTVRDVFGCNNVNGAPTSTVTVNINNSVTRNVYGGGNLASYTGSPAVYINNGTVGSSVFGGGKGNTAVVTGDPEVTIGDANGSHYAVVAGNVYGGGDAAAVTGTTTVTYNDSHASSSVSNLFGGGNAASVSGATTVTLTNGKVTSGIYGGCNASGSVGAVTIGLTGGSVGTALSPSQGVYGGGYGASTTTTSDIGITLGNTTVYGDIYGGSALGSVNASTSNTTTLTINGGNLHGSIFGGGKGSNEGLGTTATSNGDVLINYNGANSNLTGFYGGANINGSVVGDITVNVLANVGASGVGNGIDIFGGGYGAATTTDGDVTVNIGDNAGTYTPVIYGDIYGGSALGSVNNASSDNTTINFLNGTLHGNIYGGGLGDAGDATKGWVKGVVTVNVSSSSQLTANCKIDLREASIYGCNNTNGSPQDDVVVNIYKTAYNYTDYLSGDNYTSQDGLNPYYAIDQVFGGGNQANYLPENNNVNSTKTATVYIHNCSNTIRRLFGGGNAAKCTGVVTVIEGGRFDYVFGGGNGEVTAANIGLGGTNMTVSAGIINELFGGSNSQGTIEGPSITNINGDNIDVACAQNIHEFFGGGNAADITGDVSTTISCGTGLIGDIYGGSNLADIDGDVTLTIESGNFDNVYGGSKNADITGDVTVNVYGGIIDALYGGNNIGGNISGNITVNVNWGAGGPCSDPRQLGYVYGGGNLAPHTPTNPSSISPLINIINGTVDNDVFGGGLGSTARCTSRPKVVMGLVAGTLTNAIVRGSIYGGGSAAPVTGNTFVLMQSGTVQTNIFGGGLGTTASVSGNTEVGILGNKSKVEGDVYGGGNAGAVGGNTDVYIGEKPE